MNSISLVIVILLFISLLAMSSISGTWRDDFEHPNLDDWQQAGFQGPQPVWKIENGKLVGETSGGAQIIIGDDTWHDYTVEVNVTFTEERAPAPGIPDGRGLGSAVYCVGFWSGYYVNVVRRLWDGRGSGIIYGVNQGWQPGPILLFEPRPIKLGGTYRLKVSVSGASLRYYMDGEVIGELVNNMYKSGPAGLVASNCLGYFDDFSVTGSSIPDGGHFKAIQPQGMLTTVWGKIKNRIFEIR